MLAAGGASVAAKLIRLLQARQSQAERASRYRLLAEETAADGIRRIARGQIDLATGRLDGAGGKDLDKAVHEARKAFKRLRALLRLTRGELGDDVYRHENEAFRDAGRRLSGARDASVMGETLEALVARHREELPAGAFGGLRSALDAEADTARGRLIEGSADIRGLVAELGAARIRVATWTLPEGRGVDVLAPGFERVYKRGRRAARAAQDDPSAESLHELRKRAKDLWHAAQVLHPAAPEDMRKLASEAHELSDVIGEDHDLAVLLEGAGRRSGKLRPGELELLEALVERRRGRLRREALARAKRIYRRKPAKVAATVAGKAAA